MRFKVGCMLLPLLASGLFADWKDEAKNWNKKDADKVLQEKYKKYDISNASLGGKVDGTVNKIDGLLDKAGDYGLDKYLGGAIGDAQSMLSMVNNDMYQDLLMKTGMEILAGADAALLGVCYDKTFNWPNVHFAMPEIDPCIKFKVGGTDICRNAPAVPGYKKKSSDLLTMDQKKVSIFCNGWDDMVKVEEVPLKTKILESDASKAVAEASKKTENTNVVEQVKRTAVADVGQMGGFKYSTTVRNAKGEVVKDGYGQPKKMIVQPLKNIDLQDTEDKKNAYKYVKGVIEKEAGEGKGYEEVENARKITLSNIDKANVAYKNEHQYELARNEAVDALNFIENGVFDTKNEVLLFRTSVIKHEDSGANVSTKVNNIKAEKDSLMTQYRKKVDKWLRAKESYYFQYEKQGITTPTAYHIDSVTKNLPEEERYIKRASMVYQVEKEMNFDAQNISALRVQSNYLINEFERKLDIEIVANRKFDLEGAMRSVGL